MSACTGRDRPVRQASANGQPRPETTIERTCRTCKASFIGLAAGKTGERGIWCGWHWYCSAQCAKGHVPDDYLTT